jgi:hypothetical protein
MAGAYPTEAQNIRECTINEDQGFSTQQVTSPTFEGPRECKGISILEEFPVKNVIGKRSLMKVCLTTRGKIPWHTIRRDLRPIL